MKSGYFRTSEAEDVIGSLRHLKRCLDEAKHDPQAWKWVILSLFSAVQGSMVCHAAGSAQIECLKDDCATKMLAWLESHDGPKPEEELAGPDALFKRMNGTFGKLPPAGGVVSTSPATEEAFKRLKLLRDHLSHFSPKGWSIEKAFIEDAIPPLLSLIKEIELRGWAFRHLDPKGIVGRTIDDIQRAT